MRDIALLTPMVRELYDEHVHLLKKERNVIVRPSCTLRTATEHRAIYAQGRESLTTVNALRSRAGMAPLTRAKDNRIVSWAKFSPHMAGPDGLSRAYDLYILGPEGAVWDPHADIDGDGKAEWEEVVEVGESLGLTCGGRWRVRDYPHFELPWDTVYRQMEDNDG